MTVAYQTGTSTGPADLITKLGTFATANGWTVRTPTSGKVLSKGSILCGINTDAASAYFRGCMAYISGAAWDAQTHNAGITMEVNIGAGPFTAYHFYSGNDGGSSEYLHATVEISAGVFRHFVIGQLVKAGSYTGGIYIDGTYQYQDGFSDNSPDSGYHRFLCDADSQSSSQAHIQVDLDSKTNNWATLTYGSDRDASKAIGSLRPSGIYAGHNQVAYQRFNLLTPLLPMTYFANRPSNLTSRLGRVPDMRFVNMRNLSPGQTITIGGVTWQVFPNTARTDIINQAPSSVQSSGYYGYAHKR